MVLLVMLRLSVLLLIDVISWEDGKGIKRCMVIVAFNINKEIIKGISFFFIRDFFFDDVSLLLFLILNIVLFGLFFCDTNLCWLL